MDYARFEQKLAEYRLIDDDFMSVFFDGQNEIMEFILKIILNKKLKVTETKTQIEINKFGKRSVRLDILAKATAKFIALKFNVQIKEQSPNVPDLFPLCWTLIY